MAEHDIEERAVMQLHPQYITDEDGSRLSVLLPLEEYEVLLDRLEDLQDIEDARAVQNEPSVPWETIIAELELEV